MQRLVGLSAVKGGQLPARLRLRRSASLGLGLGLAFVLAALAASASDGMRELDQACATTTGCFSGDAPGFPVTIDGSAGRSYRLTSDLLNTTGSPSAILQIDAADVTLDLGGNLIGGSAVLDFTGSCGPQRPAFGITGSGVGAAIRNGIVLCTTTTGIALSGGQTRLERIGVTAIGSGRAIVVGEASLLTEVRASDPTVPPPLAARVVEVGPGSIVERSAIVSVSSEAALHIEPGSALRSSVVEAGAGLIFTVVLTGVEAPEDSLISLNLIRPLLDRPLTGVAAGAGIAIVSNNIDGAPVQLGSGSHLEGNLIRNAQPNGSLAVGLTGASSFRENRIAVDDLLANPITGSLFLNMGDNTCTGPKADCS